jgi:hypothetical protein
MLPRQLAPQPLQRCSLRVRAARVARATRAARLPSLVPRAEDALQIISRRPATPFTATAARARARAARRAAGEDKGRVRKELLAADGTDTRRPRRRRRLRGRPGCGVPRARGGGRPVRSRTELLAEAEDLSLHPSLRAVSIDR